MTGDVLSAEDREALHKGVCRAHRDDSPGVYVCHPCEQAGDAAVEAIVARHRAVAADAARAELVAGVLAIHYVVDPQFLKITPWCHADSEEWPCRMARLVAPDHAEGES